MRSSCHHRSSFVRWSAAWFLACALGAASAQSLAERVLKDPDFHGGLVVQVGVENASLLAALADSPNVLAHGLVREEPRLAAIRDRLLQAGLYGRVSAQRWRGPRLPYSDETVNMLVSVGESVDRAEVERVLAPRGVAWMQRGGRWERYRKPVPDDIDEWTHARYDATGNAVSKDRRAGPPRHLQWEALPRWNRGVKTSNLVTSDGRIFYILDDSHYFCSVRTWSLIARDAYSGVLLWRREIENWPGARGGKKTGPAQVNRRLVAVGDRVYVAMSENAPVSVLDAATGRKLRELSGTERTEEIIVTGETLVALVNASTPDEIRRGGLRARSIVAVAPSTGKVLWRLPAATVLPLTMASDGKQVVYHDGKVIRSVELRTGHSRWASPPTGQKIAIRSSANADAPGAEEGTIILAPQFAPTLIVYNGVVAFAGGRQINVVSADNGRELWRGPYSASNYSVPVDLFGFGGKLWGPDIKMNQWRPVDDKLQYDAYDLLTGAVAKRVEGSYRYRFQHHRCNQMKVVGDVIVSARAGIEFFDTSTGKVTSQHWIRGSCYYGELPANGLLYVPPTDCACYIRAKLSGFMTFRSAPPAGGPRIPDLQRLQRGPAYGRELEVKEDEQAWPTYRHDVGRSGRTQTRVGADLLLGWETSLGRTLTAPVVAGGHLYVADRDAHTLHALDAASGKERWRVTLDGRVDSPPTVHEGRVLVGCRDGSVSALSAANGGLIWRFTAAPAERQVVSRGQLESVWPVHGSVLVVGNTVYFAAGRSSYLDGGLYLYGLDAASGRVLFERRLSTLSPDGAELLDEEGVDGYLNDILSSDGQRLFLRHHVFDLDGKPLRERIPHLHSPDGFLSGDASGRLLWVRAPAYTSPHQGAFYEARLVRALFPAGRILVEDADTVYGFGQNRYSKPIAEPGGQWALFAADKQHTAPLDLTAREYLRLGRSGKECVRFRWWKRIPIHAWAMVRTADALFVAGPRGSGTVSPEALAGESEGRLLVVAPKDGKVLKNLSLPAMPVWDGMAAAGENLYVTLVDGQVLGLWGAATGKPGKPLSSAGWGVELPPLKIEKEPGLLGRWRFDEGAGSLARDCSGRGHDADVGGRWARGEFGVCLRANHSPQAAVIPDAEHLRFGMSDFSLAFWVKVDAYDSRILGKEAFPQNWWVVNLLQDGRPELVLGEGRGAGQQVRLKTSQPLPTDAWTHLVAVVNRKAKTVQWFVNGAPDARAEIPAGMTHGLDAAGRDINIPSSYKPFSGLFRDLRIYGVALTPERVAELYREFADKRRAVSYQLGR